MATAQYAETGERFDYRATVSYYHTDGFEDVNDQSIARSGRFQGHYQMDSFTYLDFQLARSQGPWGRGGAGTLFDPVGTKNAEEQNGNFRFTHASSTGNEWYLQFGFSSSEEADDFFIAPLSTILGVAPGDVPLVLPGQQEQEVLGHTFDYQVYRRDLEFQQLISGDRYRLAWGGGYRKDLVNIREISGIKEWTDMETYRFQGNIEYRLTDNLLLNMGAIREDNDINEGETSWRLGLNYTLLPGHVLRASVAQGWRQPFLLENSHNIALRLEDGTPLDTIQMAPNGLEAEQLTSYELGYISRWFGGRLEAEVKLYREEFEHEVEYIWDPSYPEPVSLANPGAILDVNGGGTVIEGFETGIQWHPDNKTHLWLSYAYADADHACDPMAFHSFFWENSATPRHTASLLLSRDFGRDWQVSAGYYYVDEMAWILWGSDIDSYDRVDLRLAKDIRFGDANLKLELIGQNLGGDYHEFNTLNEFETRTFLRATLQFR
ncbi:MAG: TonB-dependent receptor [Porticoccaceae bacterium]